ncbi:cysteine proteinase [Decorospora gaudefroyi]|uniref:Cysteine proteinase n=1 Tax=Decorospora gaudefroyi TaxID=184978 RepID=A0A6A5KNX1_9PLEO|nr:cysteine proteinase [Decorospora gaudefroyi]
MADATSAPSPSPETFEALQSRHRKEQRDLISRITQKKKQATKKTRKGVNDECERLERELKETQERELKTVNCEVEDRQEDDEQAYEDEPPSIEADVANLKINSNNTTSAPESSTNGDVSLGTKSKKPNRAKARLARRAAEQQSLVAEAEREAANAPNPRELERQRMATQLQKHKLTLHEIRADGHCLYAAVADQLQVQDVSLTPRITVTIAGEDDGPKEGRNTEAYQKVRGAAADWIQSHSDDFAGFTEDPLPEHVRKVRETGEWGGHLELLALARTYGIRICVLHSDGHIDKFEGEGKEEEKKEIWLGYYKHSHGLGEHYNSLRKVG